MRKLAAVLVVLCAAAPARAALLPTFSLREATYRADTVVLAVPIESASSGRFIVKQVLRGSGAKVGATLTLSPQECAQYSLKALADNQPEQTGEAPAVVTEALLFLAAPAEGNKPVQLLPSGLRFGTANGDVLTAQQQQNPGPYLMTPREDRQWPLFVKEAKATAAVIDEVLQLRAADGKDRTAGLLKWVERHRLEFGGGFYDRDRTGWGSLETDVFDWACARGSADDCWAAVRLYAELNHGATLVPNYPSFGTPSGRTFLFQLALNERVLDGDRARALTLLFHARTLVPQAVPDNPDVAPCGDADLGMIIQKLPLLLAANSEVVRGSAVRALRAVLSLRGTAEPVRMELQNALPALVSAYKAEKPGACRDLLAETIHTVGGPDHWKAISGNGTGMAVLLRDFSCSNDQVYFWLQVLPGKEKVYEAPTLVLERLDPNQKQKVAETRTLPLPLTEPVRWQDGWTPDGLQLVKFSRATLPPGEWRVSVRGTVGKDKAKWTSETKPFAGPPAPNQERYYKGFKDG